jgi:hypothetical protein
MHQFRVAAGLADGDDEKLHGVWAQPDGQAGLARQRSPGLCGSAPGFRLQQHAPAWFPRRQQLMLHDDSAVDA